MHIQQIDPANPAQIRAWLQLPFLIYKGDRLWVPPLQRGERRRFAPDYPFYRHSEAVFLLAQDSKGKPLGRIAVMEHRLHNMHRGARDALLYLYEATDDNEVAAALFEAAANWARARGLHRLLGPKGFGTGEGHGLLVDGYQHRPALGIPYNPPYYEAQWQGIGGMTKEIDFLSALIERSKFQYPERVRRLAEKITERRGFRVPQFRNRKEIEIYAEPLMRAYNSTFSDLWAFTPVPDEELPEIIERLLTIADPRLMRLIFKDDKVIGFTFIFPDISAALQRQRGELHPLALADILIERQRTRWLNINGAGILPEYQGLGANAVLYNEIATALLNSRYDFTDLVQVQETNSKMLADIGEFIPLEPHKRHRVYFKNLS